MLRKAAALASFGPLFKLAEHPASGRALTGPPQRFSAPSGLRITDVRGCTIASNYDYPIIRIDTNQGVYGLGEVFCNHMISQPCC
jgi:hypothetical protein